MACIFVEAIRVEQGNQKAPKTICSQFLIRATCRPLDDYFNAARNISRLYGGIRNVYVATDGSEVIEELKKGKYDSEFDIRFLEWYGLHQTKFPLAIDISATGIGLDLIGWPIWTKI